jgi:hypothetical protein
MRLCSLDPTATTGRNEATRGTSHLAKDVVAPSPSRLHHTVSYCFSSLFLLLPSAIAKADEAKPLPPQTPSRRISRPPPRAWHPRPRVPSLEPPFTSLPRHCSPTLAPGWTPRRGGHRIHGHGRPGAPGALAADLYKPSTRCSFLSFPSNYHHSIPSPSRAPTCSHLDMAAPRR